MIAGAAAGPWTLDVRAQELARGVMAHASGWIQAAVHAGNWWGGPGIISTGIVVWLLARVARRVAITAPAFRGIEALAVASALSGIVKGFAGRARPFVTPGEPWHFAFAHGWTDARYFAMPSGHVTATTAFACAVALVPAAGAGRRVAAILLLASAAWVAAARIASDQHWLSDTLVGATIGACTSIAIARLRGGAAGAPSRYDRLAIGAVPS